MRLYISTYLFPSHDQGENNNTKNGIFTAKKVWGYGPNKWIVNFNAKKYSFKDMGERNMLRYIASYITEEPVYSIFDD